MAVTILIIAVLLLAVALITAVVFRATRQGADPGVEHSDPTPAGDTPEHAGAQTPEGTTTGGQDAEEHGGTGEPVHSGYAGTSAAGSRAREDDPDAAAHVARPGEGEGAERASLEGRQPKR